MTRQAILARAIAYQAATQRGIKYTRPYKDLREADQGTFWWMVHQLSNGVPSARLVRAEKERTRPLRPVEANRLRLMFWRDQGCAQ